MVRGRGGGEARGPPPPKAHPRPPLPPGPSPASTFLGEVAGGDDRSCSVLQMAKTLSEVDYAPAGPARSALLPGPLELQPHRGLSSDYGRPLSFPPPRIRESIQEDLAEEVCGAGWLSLCLRSVLAHRLVPFHSTIQLSWCPRYPEPSTGKLGDT